MSALARKKKLQGMSMLDFFDLLFGERIREELRKIVNEEPLCSEMKRLAKNPVTRKRIEERIKEW